MEYKIFHYVRNKSAIPYSMRVFLSFFLIPISIIPIILPIFPWSLFVGIVLLLVGLLLFVPGQKVRHVIKLRKGIVYAMQNIHRRHLIKQKIYDIKTHVKQILKAKKVKRKQ